MKERYEKVRLEIIQFEGEDIITESDPWELPED